MNNYVGAPTTCVDAWVGWDEAGHKAWWLLNRQVEEDEWIEATKDAVHWVHGPSNISVTLNQEVKDEQSRKSKLVEL